MPNESSGQAQVPVEAPRRPGFGRHLASDEHGRLYDPSFRQLLNRRARLDPEFVANVEAMSAMATAARSMQQHFEDALEPFGISHAQYKAMMWIKECGKEGTQLHAIADSLRVTPRSITGVVDSLEAQGLAERVPDPRDRRAVIARLTPAGEARAQAAWRTHQRNVRELLAVLEADEKEILRHAALKLIRALENRGAGRSKTNG